MDAGAVMPRGGCDKAVAAAGAADVGGGLGGRSRVEQWRFDHYNSEGLKCIKMGFAMKLSLMISDFEI